MSARSWPGASRRGRVGRSRGSISSAHPMRPNAATSWPRLMARALPRPPCCVRWRIATRAFTAGSRTRRTPRSQAAPTTKNPRSHWPTRVFHVKRCVVSGGGRGRPELLWGCRAGGGGLFIELDGEKTRLVHRQDRIERLSRCLVGAGQDIARRGAVEQRAVIGKDDLFFGKMQQDHLGLGIGRNAPDAPHAVHGPRRNEREGIPVEILCRVTFDHHGLAGQKMHDLAVAKRTGGHLEWPQFTRAGRLFLPETQARYTGHGLQPRIERQNLVPLGDRLDRAPAHRGGNACPRDKTGFAATRPVRHVSAIFERRPALAGTCRHPTEHGSSPWYRRWQPACADKTIWGDSLDGPWSGKGRKWGIVPPACSITGDLKNHIQICDKLLRERVAEPFDVARAELRNQIRIGIRIIRSVVPVPIGAVDHRKIEPEAKMIP